MDFKTSQRELINTIFRRLNNEDIHYVVPRGHTNLPESVPGGDIDVYVRTDEFDDAIEALVAAGVERKRLKSGGIKFLASTFVNEPFRVMMSVVRRPGWAWNRAIDIVTPDDDGDPTSSSYVEWKGTTDDVLFHLANHLAYESPMNGMMIRIDPRIEESLFRDRKKSDLVFVPDSPDELLHLVCRGLYSYRGDFPEYYQSRCDELYDSISDSSSKMKKLRTLLPYIFYDADEVVLRHIEQSTYDGLRSSLLKFSNY